MIQLYCRRIIGVIVLVLCTVLICFSQCEKGEKTNALLKTTTLSHWNFFTINNLMNIYQNDGVGSTNPYKQGGALEYPKSSGMKASYYDGMIVGGKRLGRFFLDGSTYGSGMQPGRILKSGTGVDTADAVADDPTKAIYRVFKVRPDINPGTSKSVALALLKSEAGLINRYTSKTSESLYEEYQKDWNEWPADQGAPYRDVNGDRKYDPAIDIPGINGADQTLWHVYNDMDKNKVLKFYGAQSIGLEMQRTIWGYNRAGALGNTIFIRHRIVNKSGAKLDSVYFSYWSDVDLGEAGDDLGGCDTTLQFGYVYNGTNGDGVYGSTPPAVGYALLQGPMISGNPGESAIFDLLRVKGKRNLPMTSYKVYI